MIYLIISLLFGGNCDSLMARLYNIEMEFKNTQFCACVSGDYLDEYKSQVKKDLKIIRKCDNLEQRADSLWAIVKKYEP